MMYKDILKYPLRIMENVYAQRVIIYSMGALFVLLTIAQNINLFNPTLFDPIITGCDDYKIEYSNVHVLYDSLKISLFDVLTIASFAWFLNKYKFCVFTLTAFYGFLLSSITWSILMISGVNHLTVDIITTCILDFAWITYIIYRSKSNRK